jgi:hypothetical protein
VEALLREGLGGGFDDPLAGGGALLIPTGHGADIIHLTS